MKKLIALFALAVVGNASAQITPFEEWASTTGSQNFFVKSKTVTDDVGNVYVAGATVNGNGDYDILVSKFNSSGDLQWSVQEDGLAHYHDAATAIAVDGSHNVYITGFIIDTLTHGSDIFVTKYNSSGTQQWSERYDGTGNYHDSGTDIKVDGSGNVYICGGTTNSTPNMDVVTIKYNSSGSQQWATIFNNNAANLNDLGARIAGMDATRIKISIVSQTGSTTYAYGLKTYSLSTGSQVATTTLGTSGSSIEEATAIAQDADKNTYIAGAIDTGGSAGLNYCVLKFDSTAALVYEQYYDANSMDDRAKGIAVDDDGYAYVTGYTTTSTQGTNYTTIKLDPSGNILWSKDFDGAASGNDTAFAIVLHNDTTLVITGTSYNGANYDYYTIKYDTSGNTTWWEIPYNSAYNQDDRAYDIAIDTSGYIIVTGQSMKSDTTFNYTTVKYVDPNITVELADTMALDAGLSFIENRGQLIDTDTNAVPGIRYYNKQQPYSTYFTDTLISYVYAKIDTTSGVDDTLHRVDMRFLDPASNARVRAYDMKEDYSNFYFPQTEQYGGLGKVPHYRKLYMKRLWNKIDLQVCSTPGGLKYAFILQPGFTMRDLQLRFDGEDTVYINGSDEVVVETSIANIVFPAVKAYQMDSSGNYVSLAWTPDYQLDHDTLSFTNLGSYNSNYRLVFVIERDYSSLGPVSNSGLCWSTYVGGNLEDVIDGITTDNTGNQYIVGYTASNYLYPITSGAIQPNFGGQYDGVYSKFLANHSLSYSTYVGGWHLDIPNDIKVDAFDKVLVTGYTRSDDFPCKFKINAYNDTVLNASGSTAREDMFIAQFFSATGFRDWVTYFGGTDSDRGFAMEFDGSNNLLLTGWTSSNDFPTKSFGTFNPSYNSGVESIIAKFAANRAQTWTAYIGGNGDDEAQALCIDQSDNVFVHGITTSTSGFPFQSSGSQYSDITLGGSADNFMIKFNSSCANQWATYMGGSGVEYAANSYGLNTIKSDNNYLYVVSTTGSSDMPLYYPGGTAFMDSTFGSATTDGHVFQFDASTLAPVWATYVSGAGGSAFGAIEMTNNSGVIIGGGTDDTLFPLAQFNNTYYQDTMSSSFVFPNHKECVLLNFNSKRELKWSTYFGGYNHSHSYGEFINDVRLDGLKLYIAGSTCTQNDYPLKFPMYDFGGGAYFDSTYNDSLGYTDGFISYLCIENLTGIDEYPSNDPNNSGYIGVYPNPTEGNFTLTFPAALDEKGWVRVYDVRGRLVESIVKRPNIRRLDLSLKTADPGMYLLVVNVAGISYFSKIIKH